MVAACIACWLFWASPLRVSHKKTEVRCKQKIWNVRARSQNLDIFIYVCVDCWCVHVFACGGWELRLLLHLTSVHDRLPFRDGQHHWVGSEMVSRFWPALGSLVDIFAGYVFAARSPSLNLCSFGVPLSLARVCRACSTRQTNTYTPALAGSTSNDPMPLWQALISSPIFQFGKNSWRKKNNLVYATPSIRLKT